MFLYHSPIDRLVVALVRHHFWSEVVGSATERPCLVRHPLRESKVSYLEVSMSVEQQVFRFQISVDDIFFVQIFESQGDLGCIELGDRIGEALMSSRVSA